MLQSFAHLLVQIFLCASSSPSVGAPDKMRKAYESLKCGVGKRGIGRVIICSLDSRGSLAKRVDDAQMKGGFGGRER